jgi:aminomethyltransferase
VAGGAPVGHVTSGTFGPTVQRNIALAFVPAGKSKVGTDLAIRIRDRDVPAKVVKTPFFRRAA